MRDLILRPEAETTWRRDHATLPSYRSDTVVCGCGMWIALPYPGIVPIVSVESQCDPNQGSLVAVLLDLEGVEVALKCRGVVVLVINRHDDGAGGTEPRRAEVCRSHLY